MPLHTRLIPVIDLLNGQVVRGVRGDRQAYRPIVSALCRSSEPLVVARQLCAHCNARQLYVADLYALMGGEVQRSTILALLQGLPDLEELWLDGGFADDQAATALVDALGVHGERVVPVYGSESLASPEALARCFDRNRALGARAVLSLDRRDGQPLDVAGCWETPARWPQRVIVMTLERVGSGEGPDLQTLGDVQAKAPQATLIGAGGLRSPADLAQAGNAGAAAWLVASALHDLQIPRVQR
jgi:phosphoribosyl isomerase A